MKTNFLSILILLILSSPASAEKIYLGKENVVKVIDGDTISVRIPLLPDIIGTKISIRIRGIDAPEIFSYRCEEEKIQGIKAKQFIEEIIHQSEILVLNNIERGKYFRLIADVDLIGEKGTIHLGPELVRRGFAVDIDKDTFSKTWCEES